MRHHHHHHHPQNLHQHPHRHHQQQHPPHPPNRQHLDRCEHCLLPLLGSHQLLQHGPRLARNRPGELYQGDENYDESVLLSPKSQDFRFKRRYIFEILKYT